jgi:hypothetical protein
MPLLKTVEKIFIGYSQPQAVQRDITKKVIQEINASNHHKSLQLYVCEYRQLVVDAIPLQGGIDRIIETCDLAILLFGVSVGPGLAYETGHSLELFKTGRIHKLLPYIFVDSSPQSVAPKYYSSIETIENFYYSNHILFYRIENDEAFETRLREHIGQWLVEEEAIVERQKDFLKRGLLGRFAVDDIAFTNEIIALRKAENNDLSANAKTDAAYSKYLDESSRNCISNEPLDYYLIARHLRDAVLKNKVEVFAQTEFINPIHQYFATLIRTGQADIREEVVDRLESWLQARQELSEATRSFAAFQLGMLQARRSSDLLIKTVENRGELQSVRHYSAHALGMLKQRSTIQRLMQAHAVESSPFIKETLTNSIIYMMGVIE